MPAHHTEATQLSIRPSRHCVLHVAELRVEHLDYLLAAMLAILAASIPRADGALKTMYEPISMPATQPHLS